MVLIKTHPGLPRTYCFKKSAIELEKGSEQTLCTFANEPNLMVHPRSHLGLLVNWVNWENLEFTDSIESKLKTRMSSHARNESCCISNFQT